MPKKPANPVSAAELRRRAEAQLRKRQRNQRSKVGGQKSAADTQRLLHELQVRQVELEMQNAELQEARNQMEALLEKYTDLYDFAPVGYFSLDEQGGILEVNLAGAALLGVGRARLVKRSLTRFVGSASRLIFLSFLEQIFSGPRKRACEATLVKENGTVFWANVQGMLASSGSNTRKWCRVAVSDITTRKRAEEALQAAHHELERRVEERTTELQRSNVRLARVIEERKKAEEDVAKDLAFETLLADLSARFINLPAEQVDPEIMDAQRRICELLGLDASVLWQSSDEAPAMFTLTHLYSTKEGHQPPGRMSQDDFPWVRQQVLAGRIVVLSSLDELPAQAAHDRESARRFSIKSNLTIPLSVGGDPSIGALSFNATGAERDWPDALVKRLQLVAEIFTNALARKRADQAMRESEERMTPPPSADGKHSWWEFAQPTAPAPD